MPEAPDRRVWVGLAVLAVGLALFIAVLRAPGASDRVRSPATAPRGDGEQPPISGDRTGPSHKTPTEGDPAAEATGEADPGEEDPAADAGAQDGPVGEVTALSLATTALDPPPGQVSLVTPQFSPKGTRVAASSGKAAVKSVWVIDLADTARGWVQVPADKGLSEPTWLDEQTLAVVQEDKLFSYQLDGRSFALVDDSDEPGKVVQPAASPDGNRVAYVSVTTANGGGDIRVLDRSTKVVRDITSSRARVAEPAWRSDGEAVVGTIQGEVTGWALDSSQTLHRFPRAFPGKTPGFWDQDVVWQEGSSFSVNLVLARGDQPPRILARRALASVDRPVPIAMGMAWIGSLGDPGTIWAVRKDGSGIVVDTDAAFATQPDVVERADGVWVAFTSAEAGTGMTRIHVGSIDPEQLRTP